MRDHLIVLAKPKKPDWMSPYQYDQVPETLKVRELQAGRKILVTTFVCPKDTPKYALKALYQGRWNIELDLRNIKTTLGMERLRCKTPEMAIQRAVGVSAGLQSDPAADGTGRLAGGSDSAPTELQAYGTDLAGLAATRGQHPRCGFHQRLTGPHCRIRGGLAPRTNRAPRREAAPEAVSTAH